MKNNLKETNLAKQILSKIEKRQVGMKPKIYFILRLILIASAVLFAVLFSLYLTSFIIFSLQANGVWLLPGFGFGVLGIFLKSLPWLLILVALILIIVLELLVKHFSFTYRRPILYSVLAIIVFVVLGGFVVAHTGLHSNLFWKAQEGRLPVAGGFYRGFGAPKIEDVYQGIISEITDGAVQLETINGELLTVVTSTVRFPSEMDIKEGSGVLIIGRRTDGTIEAMGIRRLNEKDDVLKYRLRRSMPGRFDWPAK